MSDKKVNPFGGINFVIDALKKNEIDKIIDSHFGKRVKQAKYSYSDIVLNWVYANLCGAERLEDVMLLKEHLSSIPDYKCPSSDRLSQIIRKMAKPLKEYQEKETHYFAINESLNGLMLKIIKKLKAIQGSTLDYDNVIIENNKYDASWTYKKIKGYQPGVSFIGKTPVYIEGRGGNSNASYKLDNTLRRTLKLLRSNGIKIKRFRSDAAAYQRTVVELLDQKNIMFYIRSKKSANLTDTILYNIHEWNVIHIGNQRLEVGEVEFNPFYNTQSKKTYRYVITRVLINERYVYRAIITNDKSMSKEEVVRFYNQRGAIERNFDDLKNNFNWRRIPFSILNENTCFLIISAIVSIIYNYLIKTFSKKVGFIKKTFRLKNFIYHFITVSSTWDGGALKLFSSNNYEVLLE